jgi:D-tagatose-1,6-bisphosphate aldolase subunit GatZ/KbaZ
VGSKSQNAAARSHPVHELAAILNRNRLGEPVGVYSICSANRFVLEAGMLQAQRDGNLLLIESTSNQVNQFGGYTGQSPAQFVAFVKQIAIGSNFSFERIVFGGDHLGPHPWRKENSALAMGKAADLVRACVLAGYTKIHLDASMRLANDPGGLTAPLSDEIISERAALLCQAAELAHKELPLGSPAPLYVIGTEVPIPGGELTDTHAPAVTRVQDLSRTVHLAKLAFEKRGLQDAWQRVIAAVVQPGVEFGDAAVFPYISEQASPLTRFTEQQWHGIYEAHSTDYQTPSALKAMVRDHFAILKVGPWLTFAFREAVFALAAIEEEWLGQRRTVSRIRETLEQAMLANPEYWKGYYHGDEEALRFARQYSLSDRVRYYWPVPAVAAALDQLLSNLEKDPPPISLLSQHLPNQGAAICEGTLAVHPAGLIRHKILSVIDLYAQACTTTSTA